MKRFAFVMTGWIVFVCFAGWHFGEIRKDSFGPTSLTENIEYAGVRSSSYGIDPFPDPGGWQSAMTAMTEYFPGSAPCAIWIVGKLRRPKSCYLEFPSNGSRYELIEFMDHDKHEAYLDFFDQVGIKIFLQVEPANADVETLIDLVLKRYKHHTCVIGFGIDVEWYREFDNPEWGVRVDDNLAKSWEERVKTHNKEYRLFLKHWDRKWMPPNYRGDIIFVDDSQILENFDKMLEEFVEYWAKYFHPNTVFFQIGYSSDKHWWRKLDIPPKAIGAAIAQNIKQKCGIFWVDFTLRDVLPTSR